MTQQPTCGFTLRASEGPCGQAIDAHEGPCPRCDDLGEYETEVGPRGCACLSGDHPLGHPFQPAAEENAHA